MAEHCTFWKFFIVKLRCWWKQMRWKLFYTLLLLSLTFFFTIYIWLLRLPKHQQFCSPLSSFLKHAFQRRIIDFQTLFVAVHWECHRLEYWWFCWLFALFFFFFVTMVLMFCIILPPFQIPHFNEENVIDFQIVLCSLLKMSTWKLLMTTLMRKVSLSMYWFLKTYKVLLFYSNFFTYLLVESVDF